MTDEFDRCTMCFHDFTNLALKICEHPVLKGVPICINCLDVFSKNDDQDENCLDRADVDKGIDTNVCCWCCGNETGVLLVCGDGLNCPCSYCEKCIADNLGPDILSNIQSVDQWICFVCDPTPLCDLRASFERGRRKSIYYDYDANDIDANVHLYKTIVGQKSEITWKLETENLEIVKSEIDREAVSKYKILLKLPPFTELTNLCI